MTHIIITGSAGRMGRALAACAAQSPGLEVTALIDKGDDLEGVIGGADVIVEFTSPEATLPIAVLCARHKKAMVIGTTGHSAEEKSQISNLKSQIPIVLSSNFSMGVNALFWLTRKAAEILGAGFDLEIVELHHRMKRDAPSGTAASLAKILAEVRRQQLENVVRHGRRGLPGERTDEEIGMHAVRGGDIVGEHTVIFAGVGERLELTHRASNRETFAQGALRAAKWVVSQPPGLYDMEDVLNLK